MRGGQALHYFTDGDRLPCRSTAHLPASPTCGTLVSVERLTRGSRPARSRLHAPGYRPGSSTPYPISDTCRLTSHVGTLGQILHTRICHCFRRSRTCAYVPPFPAAKVSASRRLTISGARNQKRLLTHRNTWSSPSSAPSLVKPQDKGFVLYVALAPLTVELFAVSDLRRTPSTVT